MHILESARHPTGLPHLQTVSRGISFLATLMQPITRAPSILFPFNGFVLDSAPLGDSVSGSVHLKSRFPQCFAFSVQLWCSRTQTRPRSSCRSSQTRRPHEHYGIPTNRTRLLGALTLPRLQLSVSICETGFYMLVIMETKLVGDFLLPLNF